MRVLSTLAFGAAALVTATFANATPAAADNVGVYLGSNGFAISVSDRGHGHYYYPRRACWNYAYRRHHPRLCHRIYRHYVNRHHRHHDRWDRHDRRDHYDRRHDRRHDRRDRRRDRYRDYH